MNFSRRKIAAVIVLSPLFAARQRHDPGVFDHGVLPGVCCLSSSTFSSGFFRMKITSNPASPD
jgi:hypothetical protein